MIQSMAYFGPTAGAWRIRIIRLLIASMHPYGRPERNIGRRACGIPPFGISERTE